MSHDRHDSRDERSRWSEDRHEHRDRGRRDERGFFERAGDQVASWFGDEDGERRRREERGEREPWRSHERDDPSRHYPSDRDRGYRPVTGDYGRSRDYASERDYDRDRSSSEWARDPYRQTSRAGTADRSDRSRHDDPHYHSWRERHMSELDRDYEDYRRENQSRFESEFISWREKRQAKRGLLGRLREHMDVVGSDDQHVGTVDKVAGDRVILTKSDPESGGAHHSLSCSNIDRIEGDRVILDCSADQARKNWRDESRSRALFEREDQGEMGPGILDRSFSGTYR